MGWHDTDYDPRVDGWSGDPGSDGPDAQEQAEYDFWNTKKHYPRGYGPPWQDEEPPWDGHPIYQDTEAPFEDDIHDPGFAEHEVDDWPDPDHGREDHGTPIYHPGGGYADYDKAANDFEHQLAHENHRSGAILTQAQQWPERVAANKLSWGDAPPPQKKSPNPPVGGDVTRMRGEDTGLYGTDEGDLYDVYARPAPEHGPKAYDVIRPVTKKPKKS